MPTWVAEDNYEVLSLLRGLFGSEGFVHPHLHLGFSGGGAGRGLFAARPLRQDEVLLQVPLKTVLRRGNLPWREVSAFKASRKGLTEDEEIIVFLAALRKYGLYSEWYRYIRSLPLEEPNSTLAWRPEEVAALRGTPAHAPARSLRRQLLSLCQRYAAAGLACEELRWAAGLYWSRAHTVELPFDMKAGRRRRKAHRFHCLLPVVDLLNFHPASSNYFRLAGKNSLAYIAGSDIEAGEEVLDGYGGSKNDTYLLTHYGFLHEDAEKSYLNLEFQLRPDRNQNLKQQILETSRPNWRELSIFPRGHVEGASLLRLGLAIPDELSALTVYKLLARAPLPLKRLRSTEEAAMEWLWQQCSDRMQEQQRFENLTNKLCNDLPKHLIDEYRARTSQIWQNCLEASESRLSKLAQFPASRSLEPPLLAQETLVAKLTQEVPAGMEKAKELNADDVLPSAQPGGTQRRRRRRRWPEAQELREAALRLSAAAARCAGACPAWLHNLAATSVAPPFSEANQRWPFSAMSQRRLAGLAGPVPLPAFSHIALEQLS